jgi:hypothetical protein
MHLAVYNVLLLLGVSLLIYGVYRLKKYISMRKWGLRSEATVYEIVNKKSSTEEEVHTTLYMTIGFLTTEGTLIIKEMNVTLNPYDYEKGDTVAILYEKRNPEHCVIDDGQSPGYMYFMCLFPGMLFITAGCWMALIDL